MVILGFSKAVVQHSLRMGLTIGKRQQKDFVAMSISHREAKLKWFSLSKPSIVGHLNSERRKLQSTRREAFLLQHSGLKYLLRQGLALVAHDEVERNLINFLLLGLSTILD